MLREKLLSQIEALEKVQKTATSADEIRGLSHDILQLSKDLDEYDKKTTHWEKMEKNKSYQEIRDKINQALEEIIKNNLIAD